MPPLASSNLPELLLVRAGKRPALVPEQRAFDQLVRDRRQVDGDERRFASPRFAVQQPRQQFLAGSAFAQDQHRRGQLRDLLHQIDDVADLAARADQELALALLGHLRASVMTCRFRSCRSQALRTSDRSSS